MRKTRFLVFVILAFMVSGFAMSQTASAYTFWGWKWATKRTLYFKKSVASHGYEVVSGAATWNSAGTKIKLLETFQPGEDITVYGFSYGTTPWLGQAIPYGTYPNLSHVDIKLNTTTLTTNHSWIHTSAHEFGHAQGLNHDDSFWWLPGYCRLMFSNYYASCPAAPQSDDVNGVKALYP